jgi:YD repeat-containing protein
MIDPNFDPLTIPLGRTRDDDGCLLSYRDEDGFWYVYTYDVNGRVLTHRDKDGFWYVYTRDVNGRVLTYREKDDFWYVYTYTYDADGKCTIKRTQESPYAA